MASSRTHTHFLFGGGGGTVIQLVEVLEGIAAKVQSRTTFIKPEALQSTSLQTLKDNKR